jgi:hypothetical protein
VARTILTLPDSINFLVRPMHDGEHGCYIPVFNRLEISAKPKHNRKQLLKTLMHELVHIDQSMTGRWNTADNKTWFWMGHPYSPQYKTKWEYVNKPWEKEAYARQGPLADQVWEILYKDQPN